MQSSKKSSCILIHTAHTADSRTLSQVLSHYEICSKKCNSLDELCRFIEEGADAAIITDGVLLNEYTDHLRAQLAQQPDWSNFPLIVLSSNKHNPSYTWQLLRRLDYSGHTQILERPVHTTELISAVKSALSARARQYQIRDELIQRRAVEAQLTYESQRKNEFLAVLGHELRTPLASMAAAIELLYKDPSSDKKRWSEDMVTKQVQQLQRLVNDLIDISRVSRGKIELKFQVVEIGEQMRTATDSIKPLISAKNHSLWVSTPPVPLLVESDPVRIQQVFVNLLRNACMYTPDHGDIWFSAQTDGNSVLITCRDNGYGISSDQHTSLFTPFMEVHSAGDPNREGLGIGLSLVKQLTELHGGSVSVESEGPDKGSSFYVRLPLTDKPIPEEPVHSPDTSRGTQTPKSILIVEDNPDFSALLGETLREEGHRVEVAHTADDAVAKALQRMPDFMIIDIGLADSDGYTLAEELRSKEQLRNTILIALSGYNPDPSRTKHSFDHYIVKGSNIDKIFELIASH
ncbi:MAG: ATP-binding protein [Spirochaetota bacterium]